MRPTRGETRAVLDVAARHGLILVTPDYRATKSWMGPKAEADLTQIIEELKGKRLTNPTLTQANGNCYRPRAAQAAGVSSCSF
jgi:hypothetical protein